MHEAVQVNRKTLGVASKNGPSPAPAAPWLSFDMDEQWRQYEAKAARCFARVEAHGPKCNSSTQSTTWWRL